MTEACQVAKTAIASFQENRKNELDRMKYSSEFPILTDDPTELMDDEPNSSSHNFSQ